MITEEIHFVVSKMDESRTQEQEVYYFQWARPMLWVAETLWRAAKERVLPPQD